MKFKTAILALIAMGSFSQMQAGTDITDSSKAGKEVAPTIEDECWFNKITDLAKFYRNDNNPFIEEFDFTGRVQLDYYHDDDNHGTPSKNSKLDYLEIRRFRLGEDAFFFNRILEIKSDVDTNLLSRGSTSLFYNRMTNLYAELHFNEAFNVRAGKFEPKFGYDREVSDTLQPFFERSFFDDQIFNNSANDYLSGASVRGQIGNWGYQVAAFSLNVGQEYGDFNGGQDYLAEINYDFKKALHAEKALWVFDYMHMSGLNANSNVFNTMHNAAATYFDYKQGAFGLVTQLGYGNGIASKGDIYEVMLMPTYDITKKLQVEFRYALGLAQDANGIVILNRQEKQAAKGTGKTLNAPYLGMNYFICGYNLHLMAGVEYDSLTGGTGAGAGFNGWTPMVGARMFW